MSLIVRHDVPDQDFIDLAKDYPQICHLPDGEATLIQGNWFLTAAHVAISLREELANGAIPHVAIDNKKLDVVQVVIHPDFHWSRTAIEHDIALIQTKGNITGIPFARLYDKQDETGKQITIVGNGDHGTGLTGPERADQITRAATNRIDEVSDQWISFKFDDPGSGNATEYEGVSGPGDSGGPAFIDAGSARYIAGVSSHQMNNGKEGLYGVTEYYGRVSSYRKWIEDQIK